MRAREVFPIDFRDKITTLQILTIERSGADIQSSKFHLALNSKICRSESTTCFEI